MKRIFLLLILVLLCASESVHASEIRFDRFNIENGLQQETIRGIYQESRGFLWIATEEGLNRFDGFEFKHYRNDKSDPFSISNDVITDIAGDKNGQLWISTNGGGLNRFDPVTGKSIRYEDSLPSTQIKTVYIDSKDNVWIGTFEHGLRVLSEIEGEYKVRDYGGGRGVSHPSITSIQEDIQGRIWIGTDGGGVDVYDPGNESWENFSTNKELSGSISGNNIRSLFLDHLGRMWIGTARNGLNRYVPQTQNFVRFKNSAEDLSSLSNNTIFSIFEDSDDRLWVGTDGGINLYDGKNFQRIEHDSSNPNSLSNNRVLEIYQDAGGIIWFGTYQGLNKWNPAQSLFNHTLPSLGDPSLRHNVITDFSEDRDGNVYIATFGGGVLVKRHNTQEYTAITTSEGVSDNRIMSIYVDGNDGLWVGTWSQGIDYLPSKDSDWIHYKYQENEEQSVLSNGISDVHQDRNGAIWIAAFKGGLSRFQNGMFTHFSQSASSTLSSNRIYQIFEDSLGLIWLATELGLNLFNPETLSFSTVRYDPDDEFSLASDSIYFVFEDSLGNFWIATLGKGISIWSRKDRLNNVQKFRQITTADGLISNTVYGIQEDSLGNIWISSNRGITRFSPSNGLFQHFDKSHGLQGYDFNLGAVMKSRAGEIYFGGSNGFNFFEPSNLFSNNHVPSVQLISAYKGNTSLSLLEQQDLTLDHNDNIISLDFIALDFAAPEKNQYQYKLENFDNDWLDVGNLRRATYTNLPPGEFVFKVKAANNDGVWSDESINMKIQVLPAPWKTWWAYTAYSLMFGFTIFMILRYQMKKLASEEKYRKQLEREVDARTSELAGQNQALQELNCKLETASTTDGMTGLKNRLFLDSYINEAAPRLTKSTASGKRMLIMLIDMDKLKSINDTLGHAAGDAAINHTAETLNKLTPEEFHLIRWGGDEFMLIGVINDLNESENLARAIAQNFSNSSFVYQGREAFCGASIGYAHYPFDIDNPAALSWDHVTVIADKALYAAKQESGINWVGVNSPKREINELFVSELLNCQRITQAKELVNLELG